MFKMPSTWINAHIDTYDRGLSHPFQGPGEDANSVTGIQNALLKCLFICNWRWIH